jgi:hypothetical protein
VATLQKYSQLLDELVHLILHDSIYVAQGDGGEGHGRVGGVRRQNRRPRGVAGVSIPEQDGHVAGSGQPRQHHDYPENPSIIVEQLSSYSLFVDGDLPLDGVLEAVYAGVLRELLERLLHNRREVFSVAPSINHRRLIIPPRSPTFFSDRFPQFPLLEIRNGSGFI